MAEIRQWMYLDDGAVSRSVPEIVDEEADESDLECADESDYDDLGACEWHRRYNTR